MYITHKWNDVLAIICIYHAWIQCYAGVFQCQILAFHVLNVTERNEDKLRKILHLIDLLSIDLDFSG